MLWVCMCQCTNVYYDDAHMMLTLHAHSWDILNLCSFLVCLFMITDIVRLWRRVQMDGGQAASMAAKESSLPALWRWYKFQRQKMKESVFWRSSNKADSGRKVLRLVCVSLCLMSCAAQPTYVMYALAQCSRHTTVPLWSVALLYVIACTCQVRWLLRFGVTNCHYAALLWRIVMRQYST